METCVYHSERSATHTCSRCNVKLCFDCMEIVKGRYVCKPCEEKIMAEDAALKASQPVVQPSYPIGIIPAIVYAALTGCISAYIWEKMEFHLHVQFALHNLFFGIAIGVAIVVGVRHSGPLAGMIGFVMSAGSILLGHVLLAKEMLSAYAGVSIPLTASLFVKLMSGFGIVHWFFVSLSLLAGTWVPWNALPAAKGKS